MKTTFNILYEDIFSKTSKEVDYPINLTPEWLNAYKKAYAVQPLYCHYKQGETLLGALVLRKREKLQTRFSKKISLHYLGHGPSDFFQPLIIPGYEASFAEYLAKWLEQNSKEWDELILSEIPASWKVLTLLVDSLKRQNFIVTVRTTNGYYYVDTTMNWDHYFESFLKSNNKDLLKDIRQIHRANIQLRVESHKDNIYSKLEEVLHLYAQRRTALGQINTYETLERQTFVKEVTRAFEKKGWVELSFLKDQEENVWAFQLDWIYDGIRYHWNHAYNEDFRKYSPGKILLYMLMERAFQRPEEIQCNHMRGLAGYKSKLANQMEYLLEIRIENPYSWRNKFVKIYNKLSHVKKMFRK